MFPSAGRKPVRPGGRPVTPNRLPGRPQSRASGGESGQIGLWAESVWRLRNYIR